MAISRKDEERALDTGERELVAKSNHPAVQALSDAELAARRAAWQAPLVSLLVISVFAVAGKAILNYLHIGIPALQGAGGLLLLLVALQLLTGLGNAGKPTAADDVNVALVPLGTPLLRDAFHADRWDYTFNTSRNGIIKDRSNLTVYFENDVLVRAEGDAIQKSIETLQAEQKAAQTAQ